MENTNKNLLHLIWVAIGAVILLVVIGLFWFPYTQNKRVNQINVFDLGDFDGALKSIDAALAKNPNDVTALINKSLVLSQKGSVQFKEEEYGRLAEAAAQQAIKVAPKESEAWRALAYANEIQQKYPAAHTYYQKAISLFVRNTMAIFGDAHSYDLQGDQVKAEIGYKKALSIDPNFIPAHVGLARIFDAKGNVDGALEHLRFVYFNSKNLRQRAEASYSIGTLIFSKGQLALARRYFEESTAFDPSYPMGWYGLGGVLFAQGTDRNAKINDTDRAGLMRSSVSVLNKSIKLNPEQTLAYLRLGLEFSLMGETEKALFSLNEGLRVVKTDITLNADDKITTEKRINELLAKVKADSKKK